MSKFKKPPDKIITTKCSLDKILLEQDFKPILFDVCFRTNQIVVYPTLPNLEYLKHKLYKCIKNIFQKFRGLSGQPLNTPLL